MATTPKGIYYPNNYNEIADIPEDMKKMAESIEEVFEDTDSDLSDIKEEQTTQNNRLNSLEVDNTTNKSDILTNKQDINNIKTEQTTQNTNIQTNADNISALTSRVTETEEDISDIKEEQTEQNTNISTNATNIESLQEENENLKKIVAQLPQVTGQGTEVTLEDTIEAPFTKFDVEGNSDQETTEGYNMLDLDKYSYNESGSALNGGTVTIKDGVITVDARNATGTTTALSVVKIAAADSIEAGTYYFGVDVYGAYESTPSTNIWEYRGNRTLTEKFIIKQWKYAVTQGNIGSTPILISNDTSKTTYEPYTGGQATPSPSYERPIYSSGDNGTINEKISNKNFANNAGNGYIASDGGIAVSNVAFYNDFIPIPENENNVYYYGSNLSSSMSNVYTNRIAFYNENQEKISVIGSISTPTIYAIPNGAKYVRASWLNAVENPMLVFGGAIPYVPHQEQDYSIEVQQPFRSIGDVRDLFFKNTVDSPYYDENLTLNGWYERHYVLRLRILSNMSIESYNLGTNSYLINLENNCKYIIDKIVSISNYFKGCSYNDRGTAGNNIIYPINNGHSLVIRNTEFATIEELKAFFDNNEVYVEYLPETPLDLTCTETQIQQLENKPSTYKDFTIINSEDETKAYLEVSGIKDIDTMFDKVTNAIVSLGGNV